MHKMWPSRDTPFHLELLTSLILVAILSLIAVTSYLRISTQNGKKPIWGSKKNRNTFRASNISNGTTREKFEAELLNKLTEEEKGKIKISRLSFVPSCTDSGNTQTAIFAFDSTTPSFLNNIDGRPNRVVDMDGEHVTIDSDFYGLTQLYPAEEKITAE